MIDTLFILSLLKTSDTLLRADRSQNYNFMDSMKPDHSIQENKAIAVFFEYFMQENIKKLIDTPLQKTCFLNTQRQTGKA